MKNILSIIILIALFISIADGAPARGGVHTFVQPDGTVFEGVLKGDAAFHWIQSNGDVVVFNPKDKFYYRATVDAKEGIKLTANRAGSYEKKSEKSLRSATRSLSHKLSAADREALYILHQKMHNQHHPR